MKFLNINKYTIKNLNYSINTINYNNTNKILPKASKNNICRYFSIYSRNYKILKNKKSKTILSDLEKYSNIDTIDDNNEINFKSKF